MVKENLARGAALDREDLLKPKCYPSQATPAVPTKPNFVPTFIITYNPHNPPLKEWIKETFLILQSANLKQILETYPTLTAMTSPLLVATNMSMATEAGLACSVLS